MKYIQYQTIDIRTQNKIWEEVSFMDIYGMNFKEEIDKAYKAQMEKSFYSLKGIGNFKYNEFKLVEKNAKPNKIIKPEIKEKSHFETNPPTPEDLQAIKAYVWNKHFKDIGKEKVDSREFAHIGACFGKDQISRYLWSMVISCWNWQSEKTGEIILEGMELIKQGKFNKAFNS